MTAATYKTRRRWPPLLALLACVAAVSCSADSQKRITAASSIEYVKGSTQSDGAPVSGMNGSRLSVLEIEIADNRERLREIELRIRKLEREIETLRSSKEK